MKKTITLLTILITTTLLFGCLGPNTNTYCGDSALAQTFPTLTNSTSTEIVDRTKQTYPCYDLEQMKGTFKGINSYASTKYAYTEPTLCKSGNYCTTFVAIMKFDDKASVDAVINSKKQSAEHNQDAFYIVENGTNNVYYEDDGNVQNLYNVSWTSGNYLITMQLENTNIVQGEVRDKLLGKYPSDITK